MREWDVVCSTPEGGQYLLRINADTRRVYAVNRLTGGWPDGTSGTPSVTQREAEAQARHYLNLMGVPSQGLVPVPDGSAREPAGASDIWNFTFRRPVPGLGDRLLKVSVDGHSGGLQHVWNPVYAL